jgi:hypothetical protein
MGERTMATRDFLKSDAFRDYLNIAATLAIFLRTGKAEHLSLRTGETAVEAEKKGPRMGAFSMVDEQTFIHILAEITTGMPNGQHTFNNVMAIYNALKTSHRKDKFRLLVAGIEAPPEKESGEREVEGKGGKMQKEKFTREIPIAYTEKDPRRKVILMLSNRVDTSDAETVAQELFDMRLITDPFYIELYGHGLRILTGTDSLEDAHRQINVWDRQMRMINHKLKKELEESDPGFIQMFLEEFASVLHLGGVGRLIRKYPLWSALGISAIIATLIFVTSLHK